MLPKKKKEVLNKNFQKANSFPVFRTCRPELRLPHWRSWGREGWGDQGPTLLSSGKGPIDPNSKSRVRVHSSVQILLLFFFCFLLFVCFSFVFSRRSPKPRTRFPSFISPSGFLIPDSPHLTS